MSYGTTKLLCAFASNTRAQATFNREKATPGLCEGTIL